MKTIYKYELELTDWQMWTMPEGAEILCVQIQQGKPCLWVLEDTDRPPCARWIRLFGTGHEIPPDEDLEYIGTFQMFDGGFGGHVFEGKGKHEPNGRD